MAVVPTNTLLPGDPRLIEHIVCELKSQGIFDQFRKECIADVDTKPAYQNLRQRVEGSVVGFLKTQTWKADMNKNQLREMLRKNIYQSGFLETGVERIVDQVLFPKINSVFLPQVEDVAYTFLGLEKPTRSISATNGPLTINTIDLLPTDLDPISPDSEVMEKSMNKSDKSLDDGDKLDDSKNDEFESPPFEPITEQSVFSAHEESSNDSHVSGISGLTSHDSNSQESSKFVNIFSLDVANQDSQLSKVSSNSRLSIITTDSKHTPEKMDISDDTQSSRCSKMDDGSNSKNAHFNREETAYTPENGVSNFNIKKEITDEIDAIRMEISEHQNGGKAVKNEDKFREEAERNIKMEIDEDSQMSTVSMDLQNDNVAEETQAIEEEVVKKEEIKDEPNQNEANEIDLKVSEDLMKLELEKELFEDVKKPEEITREEDETSFKGSEELKKEDSLDSDLKTELKKEDISERDSSVTEFKKQDSIDDASTLDMKKPDSKSSEKSDRTRHDSERKHSTRYSESKDKKDDKDRKSEKSDKDKKDKDRHRSSSSSKDKDKYKDKSKDSKSKEKDSSKSKDDKDKCSKSKDDKEKDSSKSSSKDDKSRSSSSSKYSRDRSSSKSESKSSKSESKDRSESRSKSSKSKDEKPKSDDNRSSKSEDTKKSDARKAEETKKESSSSKSEDSRSTSKSEDSKSTSKSEDSRSSSSRSRDHSRSDSSKQSASSSRDRKSSSSSKDPKDRKDPKKSGKREKDDHSSSRDKKSDNRRSADRDSNDGSSGIGNNSNSNSSKEKESTSVSSTKSKSSENSDSSQGSNSGDSGQSDNGQTNQPEETVAGKTSVKHLTDNLSDTREVTISPMKLTDSDSDTTQHVKIKKPKIASNIFEARRLMKVRKKLEKMEKKRQRQLALAQSKKHAASGCPSLDDTDSVDSGSLQIVEQDEARDGSDAESTEVANITATSRKEETNCTPETSVVSKESWDALEAKLSLNVDYDSYIDENCDSSSSSRNTSTSKPQKNPRRSSDEEDCLYFTPQTSPTTERFLKKVASLQRDGAQLAIVLEDCRKMAPPHMKSDVPAKRPRKTKQKCHVEEPETKKTNTSQKLAIADAKVSVATKKKAKGKKRKLESELDGFYLENNNKKINDHFEDISEDYEEVMEASPSASNTSNGSIELTTKIKPPIRTKKPKKSNSSVHNSDTFSLPLSPESDVSASSVEARNVLHDREVSAPVRTPRASIQKTQRYSSDDLYKPRPFVSGSSRRQRGLLNNSTDKLPNEPSARSRR